jgi:protein-tyrosine phosphatase
MAPIPAEAFLQEMCKRPKGGMTEVRRDGKDNAAVAKVIAKESKRCAKTMEKQDFESHMRTFSSACWATCEVMHQLVLDDEQPENERTRLDPDHWYENNLTNASLFANLSLKGLQQLAPGRLFTTRMPRNIVEDPSERTDFVEKCKKNELKVICVLTEAEEFEKYSGMDGLLDFYREECGLIVYNRAIPDFQIPTSGDLVNNILDLTYHLSQGYNCLVHCAGGTGRTGMVIAAIVKNLGVYDPVARIRKVKSTYVETVDQEIFLKNMPKAIDARIVAECPQLARAIAAEHLIQVFYTHGGAMEKAETRENVVKHLEDEDEHLLCEAYGQTFDLIDADGSGTLDQAELIGWFYMCGAELDLSKITDVLLSKGELTREKFAEFMCSSAASSRREYDIGSSSGGR